MLKSTRLLQSYACSLLSQGPLCLFSFFRLPWISFTSSPSQLHTTPLRIFGEMHVCIFNEMSYFQRIENGCTELCLQCARGSTLVSFSLSAMPPQLPSSLCKHFHSFPFRPLTNHCWSPLKPQPTTFTLSHLPTTVSLPWCTSPNPSRRPLLLTSWSFSCRQWYLTRGSERAAGTVVDTDKIQSTKGLLSDGGTWGHGIMGMVRRDLIISEVFSNLWF